MKTELNLHHRRLVGLVLVTHLLSITLILFFASHGKRSLIQGDSISYVTCAKHLTEKGVFSRNDKEPFVWEAYRTPGYPILLGLANWIGGSFYYIFIFHILFLFFALLAMCYLLKTFNFSDETLSYSLLFWALLPNSLGLIGSILTDAPSAYLFIITIGSILWWWKTEKLKTFFYAFLSIILLEMMRPNFAYISFLIILILILTQNFIKKNLKKIVLLVGISLIIPFYLSVKMYYEHGIFSVSLKGIETFRTYFIAADSAYITGKEFSLVSKQIKDSDLAEAKVLIKNDKTNESTLYLVQRTKSIDYLKRHPETIIFQSIREFFLQLFAPQEFIFIQLGIINFNLRVFGGILNFFLVTTAALGLFLLFRKNRQIFWVIISISCFILSFNIISHKTGGRLRFPFDLIMLPLGGMGFSYYINIFFKNQNDIL